MKTLLAVALVLLALPTNASAQSIVILDVDPIIEELTPLQEFRVEQYDLGGGEKGFRVYRDSDCDFVADASHTEIRIPAWLIDTDSTLIDLAATMPIIAPIAKEQGQHTELNGDTNPAISNLFEYLTSFGLNPYFVRLHSKGTRTVFVDAATTTEVERQIMREEVEAYNDQAFETPTAQFEVYASGLPPSFVVGDTITWIAAVYDDLGAAVGTVDWDADEIQVARDAPNFRRTFRAELGNTMMLSGFNIWSEDRDQLELIDIHAARAMNFSQIYHPDYPTASGVVNFSVQFSPNSSQAGAGWPAELPSEGPEAVYWLDANGTVVFDADAIGTNAPPARLAHLKQNTPNPFNPSTLIEFTTSSAGSVSLEIFDTRGRHVRTLVDESLPANSYGYRWNGRDDEGLEVSGGVYFYRLTAPGFEETRKMVLVK